MQITALPASGGLSGIGYARPEADAAPMVVRPPRSPYVRVVAFALIVMAGAAAVGVAGRSVVMHAGPAPVAPGAVVPPPAWVDINRPLQLFGLTGSDFARQPLGYRARRHQPDGERQDILTFGGFDGRDPFLLLAVARHGSLRSEPVDLLVDLVRLGGSQRLAVVRSAVPSLLPTRFGPFTTADVTLADASDSRSCLGFRLQPDAGESPVGIVGVACGPSAKAADRAVLACVLDRIDLVSAGDDDALRGFFVDAERRRTTACEAPRAGGRGRALWIDADATPPALRHLAGSRVR